MRISDWSDVCSSDLYRSVCDMTSEFYLQTVDAVFQRHLLPKGAFEHRGKAVDPNAIVDIALLAIEGERDDISGIGQTRAALTLAKSLPAGKKKYLMAKGVGHYGIFNGRKWREEIAPVVEGRTEERRVGKGWVSTCRSRWSAYT